MNGDGPRVLAIHPNQHGFGFAVLEGPAHLVNWGVKSFPRGKGRRLTQMAWFIDHFTPDVVVFEDAGARGSHHGKRIRKDLRDLRALAKSKKVPCRAISRQQVLQAFSVVGARTKHQIALTIAQSIPELASHAPRRRKLWVTEDRRMGIFDAVAFGTAFYSIEA
ncbi:MAG TPA: hypothetical protein VJV23_03975 [Candidatus Polarisedimenticolia bacterium]|nr:hypothetical protein [Candidatus Polarisedimenticolia bacterium]